MKQTITYATAVSTLLLRIPELAASGDELYLDLPHPTFGTFALFLCQQIALGAPDELLDRATQLLNEMAESPDDAVQNLLEVSVFEIVADREHCLRFVEPRLTKNALSHLNRVRQ